jgi:hypothetical protein
MWQWHQHHLGVMAYRKAENQWQYQWRWRNGEMSIIFNQYNDGISNQRNGVSAKYLSKA